MVVVILSRRTGWPVHRRDERFGVHRNGHDLLRGGSRRLRKLHGVFDALLANIGGV